MTRHAFSLIEVLLALAVVALVMATLGPALIGTLRTERQARNILDPLVREQVAWAILREDLLGVVLPQADADGAVADLYATPFTIASNEVEGRRAGTMAFCSCAMPPIHPALAERPAEMCQATVEWSLRTAEDGVGLSWIRRRQPHLLATGVAPDPIDEVILDHLGHLAVEVFVNGTWEEAYDSSENGEVLPNLVRISWAYLDREGEVGPIRMRVIDLPQVAVPGT
jgi:prepilin-type N-terminal cleavage/methylation domain-containing protein